VFPFSVDEFLEFRIFFLTFLRVQKGCISLCGNAQRTPANSRGKQRDEIVDSTAIF
jgi:hypothetical protein